MTKLSKSFKGELKFLAKFMLNESYRHVIAKSHIRGFSAYPDLYAKVMASNSDAVFVWFVADGNNILVNQLFTDSQLEKLGALRCLTLMKFNPDEAADKLYKVLKYLYQNA